MSPANWIVLAMGVQCVLASVLYATDGRWPHALMFLGYSLANAAILWTAIK